MSANGFECYGRILAFTVFLALWLFLENFFWRDKRLIGTLKSCGRPQLLVL